MTATTAYTDGSGDVLIDEIRQLHADLASLSQSVVGHAGRITKLESDVWALQPGPDLPAMELTAYEPGPTRVEIIDAVDRDDLVNALNQLAERIEAADGTVIDVIPFSLYGSPMVMVRYALAATEEEPAQ
jgi:hypothetical protein